MDSEDPAPRRILGASPGKHTRKPSDLPKAFGDAPHAIFPLPEISLEHLLLPLILFFYFQNLIKSIFPMHPLCARMVTHVRKNRNPKGEQNAHKPLNNGFNLILFIGTPFG
ncbi:hypothetical protein [Desulforhabdus sp. TSK]|uniref:hypothetical protein n=1 Tax=Desulforhabdus sp. TSK TaxID=2925014 RepID=UPI001FC8BFC0|nr:hypothetical protein [Desulforhabdus sp. TSK]